MERAFLRFHEESTLSLVPTLPDTGFVRLKTILTVIPISKSLLWEKVRSGEFPRPVRFGRVTMWRAQDVHLLMQRIEKGT